MKIEDENPSVGASEAESTKMQAGPTMYTKVGISEILGISRKTRARGSGGFHTTCYRELRPSKGTAGSCVQILKNVTELLSIALNPTPPPNQPKKATQHQPCWRRT